MSSSEFHAWQSTRHESVLAPAGNLALVGFHPVTSEPSAVDIVEGLTVERAEGREGVYITPAESSEVQVDGSPVQGRTFVDRLRPDGTPLISVGNHTIDVFSLDGSDYELRIYDPQAEARQNFQRIDVFDYNPEAIFQGTFREYPDTEKIPWDFTRQSDSGHTKSVPGLIDVTIDGQQYSLVCFLNGETLVLVYTDGTSGKEAYGAGKFLIVPPADPDGQVTLDFNYSFVPPCGFSMFYSCPMAPPANRIAARIPAGEKNAVFDQAYAH